MREKNKKISLLEDIFITMIILLTLLSFTFNLIGNITRSISGEGFLMEYLFLFFYILPILIILGLIKRKIWAFIITGIWCLVSAIYLLSTVLFSALGGAIWAISGQFILVVVLLISAFYFGIKRIRKKNNIIY